MKFKKVKSFVSLVLAMLMMGTVMPITVSAEGTSDADMPLEVEPFFWHDNYIYEFVYNKAAFSDAADYVFDANGYTITDNIKTTPYVRHDGTELTSDVVRYDRRETRTHTARPTEYIGQVIDWSSKTERNAITNYNDNIKILRERYEAGVEYKEGNVIERSTEYAYGPGFSAEPNNSYERNNPSDMIFIERLRPGYTNIDAYYCFNTVSPQLYHDQIASGNNIDTYYIWTNAAFYCSTMHFNRAYNGQDNMWVNLGEHTISRTPQIANYANICTATNDIADRLQYYIEDRFENYTAKYGIIEDFMKLYHKMVLRVHDAQQLAATIRWAEFNRDGKYGGSTQTNTLRTDVPIVIVAADDFNADYAVNEVVADYLPADFNPNQNYPLNYVFWNNGNPYAANVGSINVPGDYNHGTTPEGSVQMAEQESKLKNYVFNWIYGTIYASLPKHTSPSAGGGQTSNKLIIWNDAQEDNYNNHKYAYENVLNLDQYYVVYSSNYNDRLSDRPYADMESSVWKQNIMRSLKYFENLNRIGPNEAPKYSVASGDQYGDYATDMLCMAFERNAYYPNAFRSKIVVVLSKYDPYLEEHKAGLIRHMTEALNDGRIPTAMPVIIIEIDRELDENVVLWTNGHEASPAVGTANVQDNWKGPAVNTQTGTAANIASFNDVPSNAWFASTIRKATKHGLIKGTTEQTFEPDSPLTRIQFIVMLTRMLILEETTPGLLSNYDKYNTTPRTEPIAWPNDTHWYDPYVRVAKSMGMLDMAYVEKANSHSDYLKNNYPTEYQFDSIHERTTDVKGSYFDWMLEPENIDQPIPRYEVAALIRNIKTAYYDCVILQNVSALYFDQDYSYENPYYGYINAVNYCYNKGYLNGKNDTVGFDGWAYLTRAEGATIISRVMNPKIS